MNESIPPTSATARRRRLWLPIGEVVGIIAVIIAALSFWDSHQERVRQDRAASVATHPAPADPVFTLRGEADANGDRIRLQPQSETQIIQEQTFAFPAEVRGSAVRTTGGADIEAAWFAAGLKKAAPRAGKGSDDDQQLPVAIATTFTVDGKVSHASAIYVIGYRLKPHFPFGASVEMRGLALRGAGGRGDPQALVEQAWARDHPPPTPPKTQ